MQRHLNSNQNPAAVSFIFTELPDGKLVAGSELAVNFGPGFATYPEKAVLKGLSGKQIKQRPIEYIEAIKECHYRGFLVYDSQRLFRSVISDISAPLLSVALPGKPHFSWVDGQKYHGLCHNEQPSHLALP